MRPPIFRCWSYGDRLEQRPAAAGQQERKTAKPYCDCDMGVQTPLRRVRADAVHIISSTICCYLPGISPQVSILWTIRYTYVCKSTCLFWMSRSIPATVQHKKRVNWAGNERLLLQACQLTRSGIIRSQAGRCLTARNRNFPRCRHIPQEGRPRAREIKNKSLRATDRKERPGALTYLPRYLTLPIPTCA